jgi:hypothetical protein
MLGYRCYFFDPDWRVLTVRDFHAGGDAEAIVTARTLSSEHKPHGFELWQGMRQVLREVLEDALRRDARHG